MNGKKCISVSRSGYVVCAGSSFTDVGHRVICMDTDADRVKRLQQGDILFSNPDRHKGVGRGPGCCFTTDTQEAVQGSDYLFICVGTPSGEDGSANLDYVMSVADGIAQHMSSRKVIVNKSTVPVGTADAVTARISKAMQQDGRDIPFEVCSNPEFLKEGSAVGDAMSPDRIIVGARSTATIEEFRRMYQPFNRNREKPMFADPRSAELTKYAANAMLAQNQLHQRDCQYC